MIAVILAELAVATLAGAAFIVVYARSPWSRSPAGRHMMVVALAMAGEAGTLLAMGLGLPVPLWLFAVGYGLVDAVVVHRLVLLHRAQRATAKSERKV